MNIIEEKLKKIPVVSEKRLWFRTLLLSIVIFLGGSLYLFARRGDYDLIIANKVFATTAFVLIGLSLALSGICYFWDFADRQMIYRKHLGLAGFAFALVHIVLSLFFLPNKFPYPTWFTDHWVSVLFGTLALVIFTIMAFISNRYALEKLGYQQWKIILRLGYLAFLFVIIHFAVLKYPEWIKWFATRDPLLPPLSLLTFIFALMVIGLRLAVWIDLRRKL